MAKRIAPPFCIEALESRIAPSVVIGVGGRVAHYTDVDGDRVTITVSKGRLSAADFVMSGEGATVPGGEALVMLDLSDDSGEFHRANLTIVAKPGRLGGDGVADIGFINAGDGLTDLGRVFIDGDLGRIVAGNADDGPRSPGVKLLVARDFGGSSFDVVGGIAKVQIVGAAPTGGSSSAASVFSVQPVGAIALGAGLFGSNSVMSAGTILLTQGSGSTTPDTGTTTTGASLSIVGGGTGLGKTGTGSVMLTGSGFNSSFGGTLQLSGSNTLSSAGTSAAITNTSGAVLQLANTGSSYSGSVSIRDGTLSLSPTNTFLPTAGLIVNSATAYTIDHSVLSVSGSLSVTDSNALTLSGSSASSISLAKSGVGTLVLSGSNTFTSGTPINSVALAVNGNRIVSNGVLMTGASIVLTSLDPATTTAGVEQFDIQVGEQTVSIVQNRAIYDALIAAGGVVSAPVFDEAGKLVSIKLTNSASPFVGNYNANQVNAVNFTSGSLAQHRLITTPYVPAPAAPVPLTPPPVPLTPEITVASIYA